MAPSVPALLTPPLWTVDQNLLLPPKFHPLKKTHKKTSVCKKTSSCSRAFPYYQGCKSFFIVSLPPSPSSCSWGNCCVSVNNNYKKNCPDLLYTKNCPEITSVMKWRYIIRIEWNWIAWICKAHFSGPSYLNSKSSQKQYTASAASEGPYLPSDPDWSRPWHWCWKWPAPPPLIVPGWGPQRGSFPYGGTAASKEFS